MLLNIPDSWLTGNIYIDREGNVDFEKGLTISKTGIIPKPANRYWTKAVTNTEHEKKVCLASLELKTTTQLRAIAESKKICPLGDKRFKETWLQGLSVFF